MKSKKKSCLEAKKEYSHINKRVKKKMNSAKEKWIEEQCLDIEGSLATNNTKKAYDTVKALTKPQQTKVNTIKDKNGETIVEGNKILERWTEYCTELYNHEVKGDDKVLDVQESKNDDSEDITLKSYIVEATNALKKGKSQYSSRINSGCR